MYPTTGTALLYAFNDSLFNDTSSASWQQQIESSYPDEAVHIGFSGMAQAVGYDNSRLRKKDWHTQAGMVSGLLMRELSPADYWLLRILFTFDENEVPVLVRAWQYIKPELVACTGIRKSIRDHKVALKVLAVRAMKPKLMTALPTLDGDMKVSTIRARQTEVKRAIFDWKDAVFKKTEAILLLNGLVWEDK